jgi:pheromone shutdown protein TraB
MVEHNMITLIGTGHIFQLTQILLSIFDEKQPEVIAVELDINRYRSLLMKHTNPDQIEQMQKKQPFIYRTLGKYQQDLAEQFGVSAGDEMLTSILYTQSHQIPCACIDMDAQKVLNQLIKQMTIREKMKFFFSGLSGFFISKKKLDSEIAKLEQNVDSYMEEMAKIFPTIKKVLIDQRNQYMVKNLMKLTEKHENIIAVVGDGHVPGLSDLLKNKELAFETIRLRELRSYNSSTNDPSTASFTIEHKEFQYRV